MKKIIVATFELETSDELIAAPDDGDIISLLTAGILPLNEEANLPWKLTPLALSGHEGSLQIMLFRDGRAILHGEITPERARGWYTEVVGG